MAITNAQSTSSSQFGQSKDGVVIGSAQDTVATADATTTQIYTNGTGSGQIDAYFRKQYLILTGATETITISGSNLVDEFGATFGIATLKGFTIENASSSIAVVKYGLDDTGDDFAGELQPGDDGGYKSAVGYAIVAATNDVIDIVNQGGGSATVDVILWGVKE